MRRNASISHQTIEPISAHVMDVDKNSLHTREDVAIFTMRDINDQLHKHEVVLVPKGTINRSELDVQRYKIIPKTMRAAMFHKHPAVYLFSTPTTKSDTIVSPQTDVVMSLLELIDDDLAIKEIADGLEQMHAENNLVVSYVKSSSYISGQMQNLRADLRRALQNDDIESKSTADKLGQYRYLIFGPSGENREFPAGNKHLVALQESVIAKCRSLIIPWKDYDMGAIRADVFHARDIRTQLHRTEDEQLHYFLEGQAFENVYEDYQS